MTTVETSKKPTAAKAHRSVILHPSVILRRSFDLHRMANLKRMGHLDRTDGPQVTGNLPKSGCPRREDGQITVLILGYVVLALLLATVVMAASAMYLEHKKLLSLADGAALAASDSYLVEDLQGGTVPSVTLVDDRVLAATQSYLAKSKAFADHDRLEVGEGTGSEAGGTAVVVLRAVAHPPVISFLVPDGIVIEAKATARSRLTQ
ncbi:Tad domain-containing protein [Paenarthrobacter sp. NPDC089316]|uniref:Tad domain-containing protein n=1 Tax=unclassified Paenarthrobacter TaxID=2634190 RepID=UPI003437A805